MLAISPAAREAITGLVSASELPEGSGIRIAAAPSTDQQTHLELTLSESPAEGDAVVEEQGANVFVEAELTPLLDDKVLDAFVEGEQVGFAIVVPEEPGQAG